MYWLLKFIVAFMFFSAAFAQAKDIEKDASISVALDFSDNINLSSANNEIGDAVLNALVKLYQTHLY